MRILGFSKKWQKLSNPEFTTFRFPRKDKDWSVGEIVKVEYQPRSPAHFTFGVAQIIAKELKLLHSVCEEEAQTDGFEGWIDMFNWLRARYDIKRLQTMPMNKLTLGWVKNNLAPLLKRPLRQEVPKWKQS